MNRVIVVAISAQYFSAALLAARRADRRSTIGALRHCGPATAPLRVCRTIFDCAERCHTQFGFPSLQRRLPLKNFKAESTAFLVAQIFRFSCQKYRRTL